MMTKHKLMAAASHKHVAVSESEPQCFRGPVSRDDENPMAHGGIRVEEKCGCGHIRSVNLNGGHVEYGTWRDPRD